MSKGITIETSSSWASGSTNLNAFSFKYVIAKSAPSARKDLAQPHAIDLSLAIPTIKPLRSLSKLLAVRDRDCWNSANVDCSRDFIRVSSPSQLVGQGYVD